MTRKFHDQFIKQYLTTLLEPFGQVQASYEVLGKVLQVDLMFIPTVTQTAECQELGLLGQLATQTCLLEAFWNPPSKREIRTGLVKLFSVQNELYNQARRGKDKLHESVLPQLWIFATSASSLLIEDCGATLDITKKWCDGVYFFHNLFKTAIVAINELPTTPDTLWVRLLGRGATLDQASAELLALPKTHPLRRKVLELLSNRRLMMEKQKQLTQNDKELFMQLSPIYLKWREETLQQGMQQGMQQGVQQGVQQGLSQAQQRWVEGLLKSRFGGIDKTLAKVIDPLLKLSPEEAARWLVESSRQELVTKFGKRTKKTVAA